MEETSSPFVQKESWFLNILKNSYLISFFRSFVRRFRHLLQNMESKNRRTFNLNFLTLIFSRIALFILLALLLWVVVSVGKLLKGVSIDQWLDLGKMLLMTFARVIICITISLMIMLPLGLAIGLSEKWCRILQPIIQVGASFPATLLFPALILVFKVLGISLGIGSIVLMLMGTQWYILFNVMAGARAMPSDLKDVSKSFHFNRMQRFKWLNLPAVFPYLITGILSASGGAWNASIVSEYVTYKNQVLTTPGIGSAISLAAQNNDYSLLTASLLVMVVVVVLLNYLVWLKLYHYSEKRFALNV